MRHKIKKRRLEVVVKRGALHLSGSFPYCTPNESNFPFSITAFLIKMLSAGFSIFGVRIQSTDGVITSQISLVIFGKIQRLEVVNGSQLYFTVISPCSKRIQPSLRIFSEMGS
eukprot:COSAG02_NODE_165_length_32175_cov_86.109490_5_plen_113_part_00